ncbi:hypothetical protein [uncultured Erythrobacter sp.]|uniref:hypothetical protein n=1 Tax=uncultured Erythrobacter sp. TaxID=263913 RepID=UPI0026350FF8|nr:hypothetical protein [uncultured Erythrobacter sp.]
MSLNAAKMLTMSQSELDDLFSSCEAGPIPTGEAKGTPVFFPGSSFSDEIAQVINFFAWQGKVFDPEGGYLRNQILPFGIQAIMAKVYKQESWLDGKECIVLDYSETSMVAQLVRDEMRMVAPDVYLGKVYWEKTRLIDFVLEF